MAGWKLSASHQDLTHPLIQGLLDPVVLHPSRAYHSDGPGVGRVFGPAHPGQIHCPQGSPVTEFLCEDCNECGFACPDKAMEIKKVTW